jgi:hypothetical protein
MTALIEETLLASVKLDNNMAAEAAAGSRAIISYVGRLDAGGTDSRLVLRLNNARTGYTSFVLQYGGQGHTGERDNTGLYIGRNGWGLNCDISFRYILDVATGRKRTSFGMSTFAHADNRILGYSGHGFWDDTNAVISSIDLYAVGAGQSVGDLTIAWE